MTDSTPSPAPLSKTPKAKPAKESASKVSEVMSIVSLALSIFSLFSLLIILAQMFISPTLFSTPELKPSQYWIAYLLVFSVGAPLLGIAIGIGTLFQPPKHKIFAISGIALNAFLLIGFCCLLSLVALSL